MLTVKQCKYLSESKEYREKEAAVEVLGKATLGQHAMTRYTPKYDHTGHRRKGWKILLRRHREDSIGKVRIETSLGRIQLGTKKGLKKELIQQWFCIVNWN